MPIFIFFTALITVAVMAKSLLMPHSPSYRVENVGTKTRLLDLGLFQPLAPGRTREQVSAAEVQRGLPEEAASQRLSLALPESRTDT